MKISGSIIQTRSIVVSSENEFHAIYKGREIYISTEHALGKPKYDHLKRFNIDVQDMKSGMYDVQTYEDFHDIKDAIRYALKGACLIK